MDAATILVLGAMLLGFGSLSLFLVRSSNEGLKGLGWLAAAFAAGSTGAGLLLMDGLPRSLGSLLPDVSTLLAFVLLQVAVSELLDAPLLPRLGFVLLFAMVAVDLLYTTYHLHGIYRIAAISLLVAVQCGATARQLSRYGFERRSAMFCSVVLFGFSGYNLLRALLEVTGLARRWHFDLQLLILSMVLYIAVGLGLAFGFFWMTSAWLSTQLEEMAGTDPLTRLSNRRTFLRACEKELRVSLRKARPFSVLMADLDHFKSINDRFGHATGDEVLVAVVESMRNAIRGVDILGRWGGEEFVVLLPNASAEAAWIVAERMRTNVERVKLPIAITERASGAVGGMTVSIGSATFQRDDDLHTLLRRADKCLYLAKDGGRNRVLQAC